MAARNVVGRRDYYVDFRRIEGASSADGSKSVGGLSGLEIKFGLH
jgi:hypothetical protein